MDAFKFRIANVYQNLTNVVLRIAPKGAAAARPAVLVNSHYDSTLGSVGASDAASCVCVMLELARVGGKAEEDCWVHALGEPAMRLGRCSLSGGCATRAS